MLYSSIPEFPRFNFKRGNYARNETNLITPVGAGMDQRFLLLRAPLMFQPDFHLLLFQLGPISVHSELFSLYRRM